MKAMDQFELAAFVERRQDSTPNALPDALLTPAFEAPPQGGWCAVLIWEVLPAATSDEHVENAFYCPTVIGSGLSGASQRRQQRLDECPLHISKVNTAHANRIVHPGSVLEHRF